MSNRQMTGPEVAALAFRILGVVFLLSGLAQALFLAMGQLQDPSSLWMLLGLVGVLAFTGALALPLIFHAETLVRWFFPPSDTAFGLAVSRRSLLTIGLVLVGVWVLASNLPYLARLASQVLWLAEGTRRADLQPEIFSQMAFDALESVFACVAGWLLIRYAAKITGWWEAKSAASTEPAPAEPQPPEGS